MPGRPHKIPSYCRHKASGQAVVRIHNKDEYLGPYGAPESYERFHRLIAERFPNGVEHNGSPHDPPISSSGEGVIALVTHCRFLGVCQDLLRQGWEAHK